MKKVFLLTIFLGSLFADAQEFRQSNQPVFSDTFLNVLNELDSPVASVNSKVKLLNESLEKLSHPYERYHLIFWYYPSLCMQQGDTAAILKRLQKGQQEGFFYPLITGNRKWPAYVQQLEQLQEFDHFIHVNDSLRDAAEENATAGYFVAMPENYNESREYPLMIILHGGTGSYYDEWLMWQSQTLKRDFISVFMQGKTVRGSFARRFNDDNFDDIVQMYHAVREEFPVDEKNVYIGGPSAGGFRSMMLGFQQQIPADGLILLFPVMPEVPDNRDLEEAAGRGMNVVIITGEYDWSIQQQKEFAYRMDTSGISNRFIIYPNTGHTYPDDFYHQLDMSLHFLTENQKDNGSANSKNH